MSKKPPVKELSLAGEWQSFSPGLDRVKTCLEKLDSPHRSWTHVLVAGTNGKGTVSYNLASALGSQTGLFLSPHLQDVRERITLAGTWFSDGAWQHARDKIRNACPEGEFSYFEWLLLLAVVMFDEEKIKDAVFEVGLGGRLDATNALSPKLSVLTNVSLDHQHLLGHSIRDIALEKIEIARANRPFVLPSSIMQIPEVSQRLQALACQTFPVDHGSLGFENNLKTLNEALRILEKPPCDVLKMLPGRREELAVGGGIYLDGAHNMAGWQDLVSDMKVRGVSSIAVLASLSKDRCINQFLETLAPLASGFYHWHAEFEKEQCLENWPSQVTILQKDELKRLLDQPLLVCGSLYFVGAFKSWLEVEGLISS